MADFSHVRSDSLEGFVRRVKSGWHPYDEYLLEAVESIRPPLLRGEHLKALRRYLDPASPQIRGRPRKDQPRKLMLVIGSERRSGPAQDLIHILLKRLASGPHCAIQNDFKAYQRYRDKRFRDAVIKEVYNDLYRQLAGDPPYQHRIFGAVDLSEIDRRLSRSEQALEMMYQLLQPKLGLGSFSRGAMLNIIAKQRKLPPRPRSFFS